MTSGGAAALARERVLERIWARDAALWKSEADHRKIIGNSLGWLTVPRWTRERADDLVAFAEEVRAEFDDVVVLGMGGSSLCSEVLRNAFPARAGWPRLRVLDSTVPGAVAALDASLDRSRTLFVVASKSGTTTEPVMFQKYFWSRVREARGANAGRSFVAVTDPGTQLEREATRDGYRRVFLNPPDIGGRYSALSFFGMVPAAIAGIDVRTFLDRAIEAADRCSAAALESNPAALLGLALGENAAAGRDKVTIVASGALAALGLWIEQLVAESTGKEGKGILPIALEPLDEAGAYGRDRLFVAVSIGQASEQASLRRLEAAGHPVLRRALADPLDLGAEFFVWELATAIAGWSLGINPFDQPNVQESKDNTKRLLEEYKASGRLPGLPRLGGDGQLAMFGADAGEGTPAEVLARLFGGVRDGDYVALLAYVPETDARNERFTAIRSAIMRSRRVATTLGYGPRFLHSTGQLHKGGGDNGVFIQIVERDPEDVPIPGEPFGFAVLAAAQAQGDFEALLSRGRRAVRVQLASVDEGIAELARAIDAALARKG
ncbi:MAG TPA: glucose-6-phosphate isomerase [Thermoanaerobaculia bacterium]